MNWTEASTRIDRLAETAEVELRNLFGEAPAPRDAAAASFREYLEQMGAADSGEDYWVTDFETAFRSSPAYGNLVASLSSLDFRCDAAGIYSSLREHWNGIATEIYFEGDTRRNRGLRNTLSPPVSPGTLADSVLHSSSAAGHLSQTDWNLFVEPQLGSLEHLLHGGWRITDELNRLSSFWDASGEWCRSFHAGQGVAATTSLAPRKLSFWKNLIRWIRAIFSGRKKCVPDPESDSDSRPDAELPPFLPAPHLAGSKESLRDLHRWWENCQSDARRLDLAGAELNRRVAAISEEAARINETVDRLAVPAAPIPDDWIGKRKSLAHELDRICAAIEKIRCEVSADDAPPEPSTPPLQG